MKLEVREEIRKLKKAVHGGDVWNVENFAKHSLRRSESMRVAHALVPAERMPNFQTFQDFSSNVNPLGPSEKAMKAVENSLWKCAYYPDSNAGELKKALSKYLGVGVLPSNIIVGSGSTELIKNFCEAFINKGDEILIPQPTYSDYEVYAKLYVGRITFVPEKKILSTLDSKTRVIFLCNPNNPTGRAIEKDALQKIIEKAQSCNSLIFLDEAYVEFTDQESFCSRIKDFENLFVLRSLTKFFALPGLRFGYGAANKEIIECLEKLRLPWNLNTLAQVAAIESIKDKKYIRESKKFMKRERDFLYRELSKIQKLKVFPSEANFFLIDLRKAGIKASTAKKKLIEKGMLIRNCSSFRGLNEYFIRVCVRQRQENLKLIKELNSIVGE